MLAKIARSMGCSCTKTVKHDPRRHIESSSEELNSFIRFSGTTTNKDSSPNGVPLQEVIMVLNRTHLFRHLPKDEDVHLRLAEACEIIDYDPNQDIVKQGDVGDAFYAIREGRVRVTIDGKKVDTWRMGADFGEHGLLHDEPRHATIRTESCVSVIKITREKFWQLGLNNMLHFEGRRAIKGGIERTCSYQPQDTKKTPTEKQLIKDALLSNENLQLMVTLDATRVQQLVDVAWKHHVEAQTEVIVEGELADRFWIIQEGSFRRLQSSADSNTEGQGERDNGFHGYQSKSENDCDGASSVGSEAQTPRTPRKGRYDSLEKEESFVGRRHNGTFAVKGRNPRQARQRIPINLYKGDCFGEVALLYNVPRGLTVVANEDSVLWGIDRKNFKAILMGLEEEQLQMYMQYMTAVSALKHLQDDEKHELAQALVEMHFVKGDTIVIQGECQDQCHMLFEGEVTLMRDGREEGPPLRAGYPTIVSHQRPIETPCCASFLFRRADQNVATKAIHSIRCHTFGEEALKRGAALHEVTVQVISETAKTMVLLKESYDMLIGDVEKLDRTRSVRFERKLSMRGAVQHVTLEDALKVVSPLQTRYSQTGQIQSNTLRKVKALGSGAFGDVELWQDRDNRFYALKTMSKGHIIAMSAQRNVINERNVMLMTSSPFIVRLYEVYNAASYLYFLMEFVEGGEVYTVYNRWGLHGKTKYAKFYTACVICAFEHLHSLHIIYRDLKPENMLLDSRGMVKITDMGLATFAIGVTHTFCGTTDYMAPEMIKNIGYTNAIDWWCLGVLIFELLCGSPPFESVNPMLTYKRVMKGIKHVRFPAKCQGDVEDLIKSLLQKEASDRLPMLPGGVNNLTSHRWYREYNWKSLREQKLDPPSLPRLARKADKFNTRQKPAPVMPHYQDDHEFWESNLATCPFLGFDETFSDDTPVRASSSKKNGVCQAHDLTDQKSLKSHLASNDTTVLQKNGTTVSKNDSAVKMSSGALSTPPVTTSCPKAGTEQKDNTQNRTTEIAGWKFNVDQAKWASADCEVIQQCKFSFDAKGQGVRMLPEEVASKIYKKWVGAKTMWCHNVCVYKGVTGVATQLAEQHGLTFTTTDAIWDFLQAEKPPEAGCCRKCVGRFVGSLSSSVLTCKGGLAEHDHDNTCNEQTCLFIKSGLQCPIRQMVPWALKEPEFKTAKRPKSFPPSFSGF